MYPYGNNSGQRVKWSKTPLIERTISLCMCEDHCMYNEKVIEKHGEVIASGVEGVCDAGGRSTTATVFNGRMSKCRRQFVNHASVRLVDWL